jgi:hypothetical protein
VQNYLQNRGFICAPRKTDIGNCQYTSKIIFPGMGNLKERVNVIQSVLGIDPDHFKVYRCSLWNSFSEK